MPFSPFLRAFFRSSIPQQCSPPDQFILLVPTSDSLLNFKDAQTDTPYSELTYTEDFLGHHVLRFAPVGPGDHGPDGPRLRETKARNKVVETLGGSSVIVKESSIFTHRGQWTRFHRSIRRSSPLADSSRPQVSSRLCRSICWMIGSIRVLRPRPTDG